MKVALFIINKKVDLHMKVYLFIFIDVVRIVLETVLNDLLALDLIYLFLQTLFF